MIDVRGKTLEIGQKVGIAFDTPRQAVIRTGEIVAIDGPLRNVLVVWDNNGKTSPELAYRDTRFVVLDS